MLRAEMWCARQRRQSMTVRQMVAQLDTEHNTVKERIKTLSTGKFAVVGLSDYWRMSTVGIHICTFAVSSSPRAVSSSWTYWRDESWFHNDRAQSGITLYLQRRLRPEQYTWLDDLREQFSGMPWGAYWLISSPDSKLSMQFATFGCSKEMRRAVTDKRLKKKHIILHRDNVLPHTAHLTSGEIRKFGRKVFPPDFFHSGLGPFWTTICLGSCKITWG